MSRSTVVFATVMLAAGLLGLALSAPASADLPYAVPTPLATGPGTQSSPSLSGRTWDPAVAWEDDASGQWDVASLFRLVTGVLPAGSSAQRHPAVAGYRVFYEDDRAGNWDIYVYDSSPGDDYTPPPAVREAQLTSDPADQLDPATDGVVVVYEDKSRGNWDIAVWDIASSMGRLITSSTADQVDPAVDGDKVVFADRRNGNWDIYCYDLWKKSVKRLTTSKAAQTNPDIGDSVVVYQDKRNGNWDVYAYYLKSGKERRLTTNSADQTAPQISDGRSVVYQDDRAGSPDLYLYDLKTRTNRRLTDDPAAQTEPALVGTKVAWRDARADAGDVYIAELHYPGLSFGDRIDDSGSPPAYDSTLRFQGALRVPYGSVAGLQVAVSGAGGTRKVEVIPASVDETFGYFTVTLRHVVRKVTLSPRFRDARYLPDNANSVTVKPKALLTRPAFTVLPRDPSPGPYILPGPRDCVVSGYLKPRHRAGTYAVKIQCWRYQQLVIAGEDPYWTLDKTVRAKVRDYGSYSSYRTTIRMASGLGSSKWKVRVVHADADHAKTESSFSEVRNLLK